MTYSQILEETRKVKQELKLIIEATRITLKLEEINKQLIELKKIVSLRNRLNKKTENNVVIFGLKHSKRFCH